MTLLKNRQMSECKHNFLLTPSFSQQAKTPQQAPTRKMRSTPGVKPRINYYSNTALKVLPLPPTILPPPALPVPIQTFSPQLPPMEVTTSFLAISVVFLALISRVVSVRGLADERKQAETALNLFRAEALSKGGSTKAELEVLETTLQQAIAAEESKRLITPWLRISPPSDSITESANTPTPADDTKGNFPSFGVAAVVLFVAFLQVILLGLLQIDPLSRAPW